MGNLFPWNTFITAATYYAFRFCGTNYEDHFENFFSVAFMLFNIFGLVVAVVYKDFFSLKFRVAGMIAVSLVVFSLTTLFVGLDIDKDLLFYLTLFSCAVAGFATAIESGGLFGLAAMFPPSFTGEPMLTLLLLVLMLLMLMLLLLILLVLVLMLLVPMLLLLILLLLVLLMLMLVVLILLVLLVVVLMLIMLLVLISANRFSVKISNQKNSSAFCLS